MKVTVCKGCKRILTAHDAEGNLACPICYGISPESGIPETIEYQGTPQCIHCGSTRKRFAYYPFLNIKNNTFYCGCRGWD